MIPIPPPGSATGSATRRAADAPRPRRVRACLWLIVPAVLAAGCGPAEADGDRASTADERSPADSLDLGPVDSTSSWTRDQRLDGWRNIELLYPTRVVPRGEESLFLPEAPRDLSGLSFDYGDRTFGLEDFLEHNHVLGVLVLKEGEIALERYREGHTPETRWISYSVTKSVVSMLVGAAVRDGHLPDLDASVTDHLPALAGSAYDDVSLEQLMRMTSGVEWNEDYADPASDVMRTSRSTTSALLDVLASRPRTAPPGERFNYSTGEAHLVGSVLRSAVGQDLSTYLSEKIWQPMGMQADAVWMLAEPGGVERGGCCLAATLRDYGRIGLFALAGGVLPDGRRILPEGWMETSTTPSSAYEGYGYLWWLPGDGTYHALGIHGQMIWMDPAEEVVVVTHSVWETPSAYWGHGYAFANAVRDALRESDSTP